MNMVSIKATNMEMTDAIRAYVDSRLDAVAKLTVSMEPADVSVEVGKSTNHHNKGPFMRCEINLEIPGSILRAEEEREDLYEAIDMAKDDIVRQLKAHKGRLEDQHRGQRPDKA